MLLLAMMKGMQKGLYCLPGCSDSVGNSSAEDNDYQCPLPPLSDRILGVPQTLKGQKYCQAKKIIDSGTLGGTGLSCVHLRLCKAGRYFFTCKENQLPVKVLAESVIGWLAVLKSTRQISPNTLGICVGMRRRRRA